MLFLRSIIFDIWVYAAIPVYGILYLPYAIVSREGAYAALRAYSRHTIWLMKVICNLHRSSVSTRCGSAVFWLIEARRVWRSNP